MAKTLIVVPTYNEAENIGSLLEEIRTKATDVAVLVVDDASKDGTAALVREAQKRHPESVFLLERSGKLGLGTAYLAGFGWGLSRGYDLFIEMDADFSHDPASLPKIIEATQRADVVIGSRYIRGGATANWSMVRQCISRFGSFYSRAILGMTIRDLTGGFNAWSREVLERIDLSSVKSEGYTFQIELKYRATKAGFKLLEVPILFADRRAGQSKMSARIVFEAILRVWQLRLTTPERKTARESL